MSLLLALALAAAAPEVRVSAAVEAGAAPDRFVLAVALVVPDGLHVNANPTTLSFLVPTEVEVEAAEGLEAGAPAYPRGRRVRAGGLDEEIDVYEGRVEIRVPLRLAPTRARTVRGRVRYQACDTAACFAPREAAFKAEIPRMPSGPAPPPGETAAAPAGETSVGETPAATGAAPAATVAPPVPAASPPSGAVVPPRPVPEGLLGFLVAFGFGLLLNLTPCVFPVIPITVGYFARQSGGRARTILLAALFAGALAASYAVLGTAAALSGSFFGAVLQRSEVLVALAALCVVMAAGAFGAFEISLGPLQRLAGARPGPLGALAMGATTGLVAAPCVGPFVVSLLAYVGARADPAEGFGLFLALGLGLGAPYVPLGVAASRLAAWPRAGAALVVVKRLLGIALLALAVHFAAPLLPPGTDLRLWSLLLVIGGVALALVGVENEGRVARAARRAAGLVLLLAGVALQFDRAPDAQRSLWRPYTAAARAEAVAAGRAVVIDFSASWCIPCRELDARTFADPRVEAALREAEALRADVTGPSLSPEVEAIVREFGVVGVPTVVFLGPDGVERRDLRLENFEGPDLFLDRLRRLREGG